MHVTRSWWSCRQRCVNFFFERAEGQNGRHGSSSHPHRNRLAADIRTCPDVIQLGVNRRIRSTGFAATCGTGRPPTKYLSTKPTTPAVCRIVWYSKEKSAKSFSRDPGAAQATGARTSLRIRRVIRHPRLQVKLSIVDLVAATTRGTHCETRFGAKRCSNAMTSSAADARRFGWSRKRSKHKAVQ